MMRRIKTGGRLILMGILVPFLVPFHMRSSFAMIEIIVCPWEWRYILKSNINLVSSFYFRIIRLMQIRRTFLCYYFEDRDKIK